MTWSIGANVPYAPTSSDPDVADDLNLWQDSAIVAGLLSPISVQDSFPAWSDGYQLLMPLADISAADDLNAWAEGPFDSGPFEDRSFILIYDVLTVSAADDLNNWAEGAVSLSAYAFQSVLAADDLDSWADAVEEPTVWVRISISVADSMTMADDTDARDSLRYSQSIIVLMSIDLADGSLYVSHEVVRHPTRIYEGDAISFGSIDRSIPAPSGFPRVGDVTVTLADRDKTYRKRFAAESAREVPVTIKVGPEGGSESQFPIAYKGKIVKATFPPGQVQLTISDVLFEPFQDELPTLVNADSFPGLPEETSDIFAPIIYGNMSSELTTAMGAVQCYKVSDTEWLVSRHKCFEISEVYVFTPGDEEAEVVPSRESLYSGTSSRLRREYTVAGTSWTQEETTLTINDVEYTFTLIRFSSPLTTGAQVRADVKGVMDDAGALISNPIDQLKHYLTTWVGIEGDSNTFNLPVWEAVADRADSVGYVGAYAYVSQMTHAEAIARLIQSFNVDLFCDRSGRLSVALAIQDPSSPVTFDDLEHILINSFGEALPDPTYNRIQYRFGLVPATNEWYYEEVYDNEADQTAFGSVLKESWDLHFVQSDAVAELVVADIAGYTDLSAVRVQFQLSGPKEVERFDLADIIAVTHYEGLEEQSGSYTAQPFKVIGIRFNLDNLELTVDGIAREQMPQVGGGALTNVALRPILHSGPYQYGRASNFYGVFCDYHYGDAQYGESLPYAMYERNLVKVVHSSNWGRTWTEYEGTRMVYEIGAMSAYQKGRYLHVLTQERTTGRVAYHRFDCLSKTWDIDNEEVVAADVTAVSSTVRGGESWGTFASPVCFTDCHADLVVRDNGEVVAVYQDGEQYTDPGTHHAGNTAGDYWVSRMMCRIRSTAGVWSDAIEIGTGDQIGEYNSDTPSFGEGRALPVLAPDGQTVYWATSQMCGNWIIPQYNPVIFRMSFDAIAYQCLLYYRVVPGVVWGDSFSSPPVVTEVEGDETDFDMWFPIYGCRSFHSGILARLRKSQLSTYDIGGAGGTNLWANNLANVQSTNKWCAGSHNLRGTFYAHKISDTEVYTTQVCWPGLTGNPLMGAYIKGPGYQTTDYPADTGDYDGSTAPRVEHYDGGPSIITLRDRGWADVHTKLFKRGGRLWAASFVFSGWNNPHFELWSEDEWGENMMNYTDFEAEYL